MAGFFGQFVDEITGYFNKGVDWTAEKINTEFDLLASKLSKTVSKTISATLFTVIFLGAGAILLVFGLAQLIDLLLGFSGTGAVLGGIVLLLIGWHFSGKLRE